MWPIADVSPSRKIQIEENLGVEIVGRVLSDNSVGEEMGDSTMENSADCEPNLSCSDHGVSSASLRLSGLGQDGSLICGKATDLPSIQGKGKKEDLRRVLDLRPWVFDKNLLILQTLSQSEDPLSVNLDWCPFFVHIHNLPYGQRTLEVNINVTLPLKQALRFCSESGEESVVRFSYKRLPNFCYLCGKLGHISRFCDLRFDAQFSDVGSHTPYRAWLRAAGPSRRLGVVPVAIRPTYVWNPSSQLQFPTGSRRGAQVFGGFSSVGGGMEKGSPDIGAATPSSPVISEQLGSVDGSFCKQRLETDTGTWQSSMDVGGFAVDLGYDIRLNQGTDKELLVDLSQAQPKLDL
ncbi:hypothetical protein Salat_2550000 [Sesamum alatum]|uniref:CCHC-type domain-containing protein n=1 Tax=Sesamum alatum TaxID=300844 RepID=A0AAE2CCM0_9LAMI|nr:hypothetical protein Salat_2550000 [Sesamum alatum]